MANKLPEMFPKWLDDFVDNMLTMKAEDARNVVQWEKFIGHLVSLGLCEVNVRVSQHYVAVSELNRSGVGVDIRCMNSHGGEVLGQGFSWIKSADACAIAPQLHGGELDSHWNYNAELCSISDHMLPPLKGIKIIAIGGTNTNCVLRAVDEKAITTCAKYATWDNRWDKDALVSKDSNLSDALERGMAWKVIDPRVGERYPAVIAFGIAVMNARSSAQITEIEGLLAIHDNLQGQLARKKALDWSLAKEATPPSAIVEQQHIRPRNTKSRTS